MQLLERNNISVELAETLRFMIADGRLAANSRINEVHLSEQMGVSRTPLREALAMLAAEGALEAKPRRGMFVRPLTREEFLDVYAVRPLLDVGALRLAGLPGAATLAKLRKLNEKLSSAKGALRRIQVDDDWHLLLVQGCNNPVLLGLIKQSIMRTRRYEIAYLREQVHTATAVDEHLAIMDALDAGDLEMACAALNTNLTSGTEPILRWLETKKESQDV
ncbi:MAG TPA: GntR family transcriptional regulator [Xanthomonadales bacterium]|nr:GntR family transcriptional regulator [Xanthomonadales bacterium]